MNEKELFLLDDKKKDIEVFDKNEWITLYADESVIKDVNQGAFFAVIIKPDKLDDILSNYRWDVQIGYGKPGFCTHYENGKEITEYYRYSSEGIEPIVYFRNFYGAKKKYLEIAEEIRLFFDLYEDYKALDERVYIEIDDNGDENEVLIIKGKEVKVRLKYIKEYLSARDMFLVIYFEFMRFSEKTLAELGLTEQENNYSNEKRIIYNHLVRPLPSKIDDYITQSWLTGKIIIKGLKNYKADIFGLDRKKYEEFIIGIDEDGNDKYFTCNEEELANYFGKNPNNPNYLTPVFFKKEVLNKYYNNPQKYTVSDGYLTCNSIWSLRLDNNHPKYIMVFLGDLGKLTQKEQLYWKSFNVCHCGGISSVAWKRGFMGQFTDPDEPCLYFKMRFEDFQKDWFEKYGWYFFKPLSKEDYHHYKSLHLPAIEERKEFDDQILSLTKIIIDSLNEVKLSEGLIIDKQQAKGIDKLEYFLESKGLTINEMITFFRNLQSLRSTSVAHRKSEKSKDYSKVQQYFELGKKNTQEVFADILLNTIKTLNTLRHYFL